MKVERTSSPSVQQATQGPKFENLERLPTGEREPTPITFWWFGSR